MATAGKRDTLVNSSRPTDRSHCAKTLEVQSCRWLRNSRLIPTCDHAQHCSWQRGFSAEAAQAAVHSHDGVLHCTDL